ncbi:MAG: alpha/beta fold hydrolase [candidate division Zixibacteria bacterium]|nr:alpha/beta fold hydrolase [candidate division Zixibacteria bacterium]
MPYALVQQPDASHRLFYLDMFTENTTRPPVIFLHGFTLDHRMWVANAHFFRDYYRVLLLDAKGHGLSDSPGTGYSRADRVEDLRAYMDALRLDKAHVVGLSMGGSTAIGLALDHQDRLASLTLVDTGAAGFSAGVKIERIDRLVREKGLEAARRKWMDGALVWYKKDKEHIRALMHTMITEHSGAVWLDPQRGRYPRENDLERVHEIKVPTMIFVGELDRIFLPLAEKLHERISGSRLSIFEGVGHMLNLEAPEKFNRELKVFLEGAAGSE